MTKYKTAGSAKRTPGPKSRKGKAVSKLNPLKHGAFLQAVLPHERAAYQTHRTGIVESFKPVGFLEEALAERVALLLWRLGRVQRWEAAEVGREHRMALDAVTAKGDLTFTTTSVDYNWRPTTLSEALWVLEQEGIAPGPEAVEAALEQAERYSRKGFRFYRIAATPDLVVAVTGLNETDALEAGNCLHEALNEHSPEAALSEVYEWDGEPEELPGLMARILRVVDVDKVRSAFAAETSVAKIRERRLTTAVRRYEILAGEAQERTMPSANVLDKVQRYEAHLERGFYKALHELEAMQDRRQGKPAPLGRLQMHGVE